jgi:hypothetical protein
LNKKGRRLRNLLLILTAAAVIAGLTIYLVFAAASPRRSRKLLIDDLLVEVDYEISLGYYERALEHLDHALDGARGEYNSLRILRRVYQISYNLDDFTILHGFALRAADNIPGSRELEQIYLYAAVRSSAEGRQGVAERLSRSRWPYLQAEAYFTGLLEAPPDLERTPELWEIMSMTTQRDPYQLQRLGTDLDEPKLHLDAALLWMAEGDGQSVFAVMNRHLGDPSFGEPGIYISYDSGHEQTALSLLREMREQGKLSDRVDLQVMEADLRLILGEAAEATRLYRQIIASHPAYSWIPYLNLAAIAEDSADKQRAYALRQRAYRQFPAVGAVVTAYARSLAENGDRQLAAETLEGYLSDQADDYQAQLLLLDVQNKASSPVIYQAALWKLYNQHPESRTLCEHLFTYLLEFNDLPGAESVLRHYQAATGRSSEPWFLDYRAVLAAVRREEAQAISLLRDRVAVEDNWQARFNLAVLLSKNSKPNQAIEQLIEAENLLPEARNRYYRSRIRSMIGEQYLMLGDRAAARRECEYALDLDVSNFHAHRILRILEGE